MSGVGENKKENEKDRTSSGSAGFAPKSRSQRLKDTINAHKDDIVGEHGTSRGRISELESLLFMA